MFSKHFIWWEMIKQNYLIVIEPHLESTKIIMIMVFVIQCQFCIIILCFIPKRYYLLPSIKKETSRCFQWQKFSSSCIPCLVGVYFQRIQFKVRNGGKSISRIGSAKVYDRYHYIVWHFVASKTYNNINHCFEKQK